MHNKQFSGEGTVMVKRVGNKELLAKSLIELMEQKTLAKVSVQMIAENCGLTRQTFYYYYKDKYDLVNQVFQKLVNDVYGASSPDTPWEKVLGDMLFNMQQHKKFYANALAHTSQNSLDSFMKEYTRTAYVRALEKRIPSGDISEDLTFAITFNSYGAVGVMSEWIENDMREDPYLLAARIAENMPGPMKVYFMQ